MGHPEIDSPNKNNNKIHKILQFSFLSQFKP